MALSRLRIDRVAVSSVSQPLPTALSATAGDTQVTLSWTAPSPNDGVTDYRVEYRTSPAGEWQVIADPVGTATTKAVTGLVNGTAYDFRIAAIRGTAVGSFTAPVSATPAGTPGPSGLQATAGDGSVALSWSPPVPVTGVTDYAVQYRTSPAGAWQTFAHTASTATSRTVTALTNGTAYDFRVAAVRSGTVGEYTAGPITATPTGVVQPPPPAGGLAIYNEHVGFGNPGLTNPVSIVVTSNANTGPGTLRAAVAGSAHKHITFASDMTITHTSSLNPGPNTLIDGRGRNIRVKGTPTSGAFVLTNTFNVTIAHIAVSDAGDLALTGADTPYDGILLESSNDVWIHHVDFSRCADKAFVVQGSVGVTISWCHFHDQEQTFQIGDNFGGEERDSKQTVTVHHNYFNGIGYRTPTGNYGRFHVYNNYMRDWGTWAVRSQRIARVHVERNCFLGIRDAKATMIKGPTAPGKDERDGFLTLSGNVTLAGSINLIYAAGGTTFNPSDFYSYTAEVASQALADRIVAGAGPN